MLKQLHYFWRCVQRYSGQLLTLFVRVFVRTSFSLLHSQRTHLLIHGDVTVVFEKDADVTLTWDGRVVFVGAAL